MLWNSNFFKLLKFDTRALLRQWEPGPVTHVLTGRRVTARMKAIGRSIAGPGNAGVEASKAVVCRCDRGNAARART
jgi:hypothetical protein